MQAKMSPGIAEFPPREQSPPGWEPLGLCALFFFGNPRYRPSTLILLTPIYTSGPFDATYEEPSQPRAGSELSRCSHNLPSRPDDTIL